MPSSGGARHSPGKPVFTALLLPFVVVAILGIVRFFVLAARHRPLLHEHDAKMQRRFRRAALAVLVVGGVAAIAAYRTGSAAGADDIIGYNYGSDGTAYPIHSADSRQYQMQMQMMGGKANVLAGEASAWMHGRKLAVTLVVASLAGCLVFMYLAERAGWRERVAGPH